MAADNELNDEYGQLLDYSHQSRWRCLWNHCSVPTIYQRQWFYYERWRDRNVINHEKLNFMQKIKLIKKIHLKLHLKWCFAKTFEKNKFFYSQQMVTICFELKRKIQNCFPFFCYRALHVKLNEVEWNLVTLQKNIIIAFSKYINKKQFPAESINMWNKVTMIFLCSFLLLFMDTMNFQFLYMY